MGLIGSFRPTNQLNLSSRLIRIVRQKPLRCAVDRRTDWIGAFREAAEYRRRDESRRHVKPGTASRACRPWLPSSRVEPFLTLGTAHQPAAFPALPRNGDA